MYELKIFKSRISISFGFLAAITLMFIFDTKLNAFMAAAAFVFHELSHMIFIKIFGGKINSLRFSLIELDIKTETSTFSNIQNFVVAVAGSMMNFVLALAFMQINPDFSAVNMAVGCFQLLPISTLDGSNALAFLGVSQNVRFNISIVTSFIFAVLGFMVLIYSKYNFSILAISLYLIYISLMCQG